MKTKYKWYNNDDEYLQIYSTTKNSGECSSAVAEKFCQSRRKKRRRKLVLLKKVEICIQNH